jgi:three-Cys-motif partner protein
MPAKSLFDQPFDESTLTKLALFEAYTQSWLPVWVMSGVTPIHIFDLFAGAGYDKRGVAGSSIRILEKIREQVSRIDEKQVQIVLHLNEFEPGKGKQSNFESLRIAVREYLEQNEDVSKCVVLNFYNEDFEVLFPKLLPLIRAHPSLVFLDQNGIKFLSSHYLNEFASMRSTDFLYFAAASYLRRFGSEPEFRKHLALDIDKLDREPYRSIHRGIVKQLREQLPIGTELSLYPFSLQKGSNIYGIIFGATHPRAVDKFLDIAWKMNPINGDANFDIDDDRSKSQGELFDTKLTKRELFKTKLAELVLSGAICHNRDALDFAYAEGHPASQAREVLQKLKRDGRISYEGSSPLITYDQVYRHRRILRYKIVEQ